MSLQMFRVSKSSLVIVILAALACTPLVSARQQPAVPLVRARARVDKRRLAAEVRAEFLHAWNGYKKYAWGHDDLRPLSKTPHDWYGQTLLMTPVDALDTMILMSLTDEAKNTREYINCRWTFGHTPLALIRRLVLSGESEPPSPKP